TADVPESPRSRDGTPPSRRPQRHPPETRPRASPEPVATALRQRTRQRAAPPGRWRDTPLLRRLRRMLTNRNRTPGRRNPRKGSSNESLVCLNRHKGACMVHQPRSIILAASFGAVIAFSQTIPPVGSNAMLETRTSSPQVSDAPKPPVLTAEQRGDILMAR